MLPKYPKDSYSPTFRFLKIFLLAEIGLFGTSYYYYYRLKNSKDYRHDMYENRRWLLNAYYKLTSIGGYTTSKYSDFREWGVKDD